MLTIFINDILFAVIICILNKTQNIKLIGKMI